MKSLNSISQEREDLTTMLEITSAFEGIASMRIAQIRDMVRQSESFFGDLWRIYSQLRVDELFHFGRSQAATAVSPKELMILITSEGGLSGDIDKRLVEEALEHYKPEHNDIVIIGDHGAVQLAQRNVRYVRRFKLPEKDQNINVAAIVSEVQKYTSTIVYYQSYISLANQDVKSIPLSRAVAERGQEVNKGDEIISEQNYIFEPSTFAVVDHLERTMLQITLSEVILESKLAQYASRFRAMSDAHNKTDDSLKEAKLLYGRLRRQIKDERLKEVVNGLRRVDL